MTTASCHRSTPAAYCDGLPAIIQRIADVTEKTDPAERVPTCPDWNVGDLVEHVGLVHRWATAQVEALTPERIPAATLGIIAPDEADRPAWLSAFIPRMVEVFRAADPDAPMWAWGEDKHARFWPRRMTHETTIHRTDAEFAAGIEPDVASALAVDGVDEFLDNLSHAAYFAPRVAELKGAGEAIMLRAEDAGIAWTVTLGPDGFTWDHDRAASATATLQGTAEDLYLFVWGRRKLDDAVLRTTGDRSLVEFWVERSSL
jgi:uncharacterized protein (TIGR03083 family)